ncbi:hypothetical protein A3B21_02225 [Candidatus Uhrbacteria bacterium RIFCSPLOWO2_01_FULL_47_24]|uniref:Cob(I)yrinic acid a,c-diamide adenosyltransferase n=1 Tax=Candidatus Uhrbacteria bacterium RIFCSPLOWO2_01_FULL_47_24 TaxID=1802401 RepID=A0A1F7UR42_9BACT|nr:MAG: hypothetical protein A3D58_00705 [Candidatus Uhrbacteria bacterium RIFCSPHIGHO2_02_FULL_46_47]OGL75451.1 MAG: hypothetical protein A3F52_05420 [Candidatus Uhrbacteria bacterium RIFCSPHIGHO2_12_FULL_47_11]OGL80168.1 MAG: hypothetical protein A3B21_02225 [Candidatus Uhrbacteria bacterium RIFCSPLOWO2_01_FULL_47_24]OGL84954.1 MAG: hypothetical protein A3J03_04610 [Candidatus Uhrbacteria bacterium RIFCSPLOWO2_02_FULL_46_25]
MNINIQKGLVMIYWGYGKGKSTAAVGLAVRALGQGKRVLFMQFMKGGKDAGWETGEGKMFKWLEQLPSPGLRPPSPLGRGEGEGKLEFHIVGKGWVRIMGDKKPIEEHEEAAREGLEFVMKILRSTGSPSASQWEFDVVILDEILSAVDSALLSVEDIKALIRAKPPEVYLIMTGHKEYPELAELADLVTKMQKVKHPYDKGIKAQKGIDF